jgi:endoglucanase
MLVLVESRRHAGPGGPDRRPPRVARPPVVALVALVLALLVAGACAPDGSTGAPPNPLAGARLWVDPQSSAQQQADGSLEAITSQPVATWFVGPDDPYAEAERVTTTAEVEAALPVLVAYHRPGRDCGSYSAGGAADAESYLAWVGRLAAGIGDRPALVVLEPDAVPQSVAGQCGAGQQAGGAPTLQRAVELLAQGAGTTIFVDAGHAGWIEDLPALATALRASGVERADGFSLNVANFQTTADSVAYGERLSALLDQAPFVVDVSRNGRGAPAAATGVDAWCNVPGAGLGEDPHVGADRALAVAFLWIKEPGASDGSCRPGEPPAGQFWPDYARRLVEQRP